MSAIVLEKNYALKNLPGPRGNTNFQELTANFTVVTETTKKLPTTYTMYHSTYTTAKD